MIESRQRIRARSLIGKLLQSFQSQLPGSNATVADRNCGDVSHRLVQSSTRRDSLRYTQTLNSCRNRVAVGRYPNRVNLGNPGLEDATALRFAANECQLVLTLIQILQVLNLQEV